MKSLLEVLKEKDIEAIKRLIVPWDPQIYSVEFVQANYKVFPFDFEYSNRQPKKWNPLPQDRHFIFDQSGGFYIHHSQNPVGKMHICYPETTVLFSQPNEELTGIVLGRRLPWSRPYESKPENIDYSVYIYIESGARRRPSIDLAVNGRLAVSEDKPILYFAVPFQEGAKILERFDEEIVVRVPRGYNLI